MTKKERKYHELKKIIDHIIRIELKMFFQSDHLIAPLPDSKYNPGAPIKKLKQN